MADFKIGCILIALGAKVYGRLAFNCALSLKGQDVNLPVWLFYEKSAIAGLTASHLKYFDKIVEMPAECYVFGDRCRYFRSKAFLYDLSPFERTIWADADSLFFDNGKLFSMVNDIKHQPYQPMVYNRIDVDTKKLEVPEKPSFGIWSNSLETVVSRYELQGKKIPQTNTSFIWFRKCEEAETLFNEVKRLNDEPKPPAQGFRGEYPDEFFYNIACARTGIQPEKVPFLPLADPGFEPYDPKKEKSYDDFLVKNHAGITLMGVNSKQQDIDVYNRLLQYYHGKFNFGNAPFYYENNSKYRG